MGLPVLAAAARLTPAHIWRICATRTAPFVARHLPTPLAALTARIHRLVGGRQLAYAADEMPPRLAENLVEPRCSCSPRAGRTTGRASISRGSSDRRRSGRRPRRGALDGYFAYDSLVTKMALHRAGCAVSHLSHPGHGFSSSRVGTRVLNKAVRWLEDRYLRERVLLSTTAPSARCASCRSASARTA